MMASYHRKTKMYLISSFNSSTAFNYSPHFIITTNSHMWGTFLNTFSLTLRGQFSLNANYTQYSCRVLLLVWGHYRNAIVAKLDVYLKKSQALRCQAYEGFKAYYILYSEISDLLLAIRKEDPKYFSRK